MKREEAYIGQPVTVEGYGGFAEILHIEEDGIAPNGGPKYRATIKWGPNNTIYGTAKRSLLIEDYALGRLTPASEAIANERHQARLEEINDLEEAELLARLQALKAELAAA